MAKAEAVVWILFFFEMHLKCSFACLGSQETMSLEFLFKKRVMLDRMRYKRTNKAELENFTEEGEWL